jgi:hypothetical protein
VVVLAEHVGEAEIDELDLVFLDQIEHFLDGGRHGQPRWAKGVETTAIEQGPCQANGTLWIKQLHPHPDHGVIRLHLDDASICTMLVLSETMIERARWRGVRHVRHQDSFSCPARTQRKRKIARPAEVPENATGFA